MQPSLWPAWQRPPDGTSKASKPTHEARGTSLREASSSRLGRFCLHNPAESGNANMLPDRSDLRPLEERDPRAVDIPRRSTQTFSHQFAASSWRPCTNFSNHQHKVCSWMTYSTRIGPCGAVNLVHDFPVPVPACFSAWPCRGHGQAGREVGSQLALRRGMVAARWHLIVSAFSLSSRTRLWSTSGVSSFWLVPAVLAVSLRTLWCFRASCLRSPLLCRSGIATPGSPLRCAPVECALRCFAVVAVALAAWSLGSSDHTPRALSGSEFGLLLSPLPRVSWAFSVSLPLAQSCPSPSLVRAHRLVEGVRLQEMQELGRLRLRVAFVQLLLVVDV